MSSPLPLDDLDLMERAAQEEARRNVVARRGGTAGFLATIEQAKLAGAMTLHARSLIDAARRAEKLEKIHRPSDAEIRAWMARHNLEANGHQDMRCAFQDAQTFYPGVYGEAALSHTAKDAGHEA